MIKLDSDKLDTYAQLMRGNGLGPNPGGTYEIDDHGVVVVKNKVGRPIVWLSKEAAREFGLDV